MLCLCRVCGTTKAFPAKGMRPGTPDTVRPRTTWHPVRPRPLPAPLALALPLWEYKCLCDLDCPCRPSQPQLLSVGQRAISRRRLTINLSVFHKLIREFLRPLCYRKDRRRQDLLSLRSSSLIPLELSDMALLPVVDEVLGSIMYT